MSQRSASQSVVRVEGPVSATRNMDLIDLEEENRPIDRYQFQNLDTKVRIRNEINIHYAGYFLKTESQAVEILKSCEKYIFKDKTLDESLTNSPTKSHTNSPSGSPRKYRPRADQEDPDEDPIPFWRSDSVISLLEEEHRLIHFCSTWPEHGDKVLPGPVTFTLGGEHAPLVPSLVVAVKSMRIGDIKVVHVPPDEVYGLDMSPVKQPLPPSPDTELCEERDRASDQESRELETPVPPKREKPDACYSSSSEDDYDPDEEFSEPWCDAPGTKGDRVTFFRTAGNQGLEVHRGLTGLLYVVQLLGFGESQPEREVIQVRAPLETDKKTDKPAT